jgi:hypothetical protein
MATRILRTTVLTAWRIVLGLALAYLVFMVGVVLIDGD